MDASTRAKALFGASRANLRALVEHLGQPSYRVAQLADALYKQGAASLDEMSTLPLAMREALKSAGYEVGLPELAQTARSVDGTERYLVRLADGETVETVWMPDGDLPEDDALELGRDYKRATICVSSQVGCAVNCQFCLTAKLGIRRNLTAGEIAGQVAAVLTRHGVTVGSGKGRGQPDRINLVFMGMGEPFLNYDAFMDAVRLLVGEIGIPASRMTVSTSGIEPAIRRFAGEEIRPHLALSLNASNDAIRAEIMPITRKWNIAALLEAVRTIPFRQTRVRHLRVRVARRRQRSARARARGACAAQKHAGEGEPDRLEPRAGRRLSPALAGERGPLPQAAGRGWHPYLYSQAARTRHLCRVWAAEADS